MKMKTNPTNPNDLLNSKEYFLSEKGFGGGLTKREYFAALAIQGLLNDAAYGAVDAAEYAVTIADALIAELNKEQK